MSTGTIAVPTTADDRRVSHRATAILFASGGVLLAAGGQQHPRGSGDSLDAHLLSMFESPAWPLSHLLMLAGTVLSVLAFLSARRTEAFGPRVQRWLPAVAACWAFGAAELVPHLLAAGDAHALEHHEATPVLDVHLVMQLVAGPLVGLSGAVIAVVVHLATRSWATAVLAGFAVVGGLLSAAAAPLVVLTGDPAFTLLFPFQAGLAVWLVGTGVRLLRR